MVSSRTRISVFLILVISIAAPVSLRASAPGRNLAPAYRHWLNEEVTYIITSDERKQFLALVSDAERDSFIQSFWDARNPGPISAGNTYKEEHYRRLAYANQNFGNLAAQDGWRTDQGHIYILLGAPEQRESFLNARNVRPLLIWFYESKTLALPAHFYIVFYKRSDAEPFTLYSPYQDGPVRLITGLEALNDQKKALDQIKKSLGDEVARTMLSLIPGEPVSLDKYEPSMQSDVLLSTIQGLADNPVTQEQLALNRAREHTSASIFLGGDQPELMTDVLRDDQGKASVHFLLRKQTPDAALIGTVSSPKAAKQLGYTMTLRASIQTADGKPVYDQEEVLARPMSDAEADVARQKDFAAEGRLPLAPGTYELTVTLTNNLNHLATRAHRSVTVTEAESGKFGMSQLLAYTQPAPVQDAADQLPFSFSHLRFTPRGLQTSYIHQGEKLPIVFQLWLDPKAGTQATLRKVHLHYVYGTVAIAGQTLEEEDEEIDAGNLDPAGNLLTGHTLDTSRLIPGTYRMIAKAADEATGQSAFSAMVIKVLPPSVPVSTWTAYTAVPSSGKAEDDLKRGLSADAQGAVSAAGDWYSKSLSEDPSYQRALGQLASNLATQGKTAELAGLSHQAALQKASDPKTVVLIAQALIKINSPKAAAQLLDSQLKMQQPTAELDSTLADAYEKSGDSAKAKDLRRQAAVIAPR